MRDTAQESLDKISRLVSFIEDEDGDLQVQCVNGDIHGTVWGNIHGNVYGFIEGNVVGGVDGYISGSVRGSVKGSVNGVSSVQREDHEKAEQARVAKFEAESQEWYARQVEILNRPAT
jgi:outer membrane lipoprotein SlyB